MKRKSSFVLIYILSVFPMLFSQYGVTRGVNEISGWINLLNPIGIMSTLLYFGAVIIEPIPYNIRSKMGLGGLIGIVIAEIYTGFTWYDSGQAFDLMNFELGLKYAFPEFYFGVCISVLAIILYCFNLRGEIEA